MLLTTAASMWKIKQALQFDQICRQNLSICSAKSTEVFDRSVAKLLEIWVVYRNFEAELKISNPQLLSLLFAAAIDSLSKWVKLSELKPKFCWIR